VKLRTAKATERYLDGLKVNVPHAQLLVGPKGIGLSTLARHIAAHHGKLLAMIAPESKTTAMPSIGVERIRELYTQTRTRQNGTYFVVIDEADTMNHTAQNALLKLLEEPNESVNFILTSHSPDRLLPTIRSRVQSFTVPRVSTVDSGRILTAAGVTDKQDIQRLLYVAEGLPAELTRLATDSTDFRALFERVQTARQLITGTPYQRLILASSFGGDRQEAILLLETALLLLRRSLRSQVDTSSLRMIAKLSEASEAIRANGALKLHLSVAVL
jgi:DNA polymerase III delta prime subunit